MSSTFFCNLCNKEATGTCETCYGAHYCSVECKYKDWPNHKPICKQSALATKAKEVQDAKDQAQEIERRLGPDHEDTLISMNRVGLLLRDQGNLKEAESWLRRALEGSERTLGPDHPTTLCSINNYAGVLKSQGKITEAEVLYRRFLEGSERTLGPDHPDTLSSNQ